MKVVAVFAVEGRVVSYISSDRSVPHIIVNSENPSMSKIMSNYRRMAFERPGYTFRLTILNNDQSILHEFEMKPEPDSLWIDVAYDQARLHSVFLQRLATERGADNDY